METLLAPRRDEKLLVGPGASAFVFEGRCVELREHMQLARVLHVLASAHLARPGEWIDCRRLIEIAWRGERMTLRSAMNRLHVTIAKLRALGLRSVLESKRGAYRLKDDVRLVLVERAPRGGVEHGR